MATKIRHVKAIIQLRRATESEWIGLDPVLRLGEPAYSMDVNKLKIGDGIHKWSETEYLFQSEFDYIISLIEAGNYTAGNGITIDENNEISIDTSIVAQLSDIHNSTVTLQQGGETIATIGLNQSFDQTIDLGNGTNWIELIAVPFDSQGHSYADRVELTNIAYWKITSRDLIDFETYTARYYSGQELQGLINNNSNCYIRIFSIPWPIVGEMCEFSYFADLDGINGKHEGGFHGSSGWAVFTGRGVRDFLVMLFKDSNYLAEATMTLISNVNAGNGIVIENPSNREETIFSLDDLILDCGTSTINIGGGT